MTIEEEKREPINPDTFTELTTIYNSGVHHLGNPLEHAVYISPSTDVGEPMIVQTIHTSVRNKHVRIVTWTVHPDNTAAVFSAKFVRLGRPFNQTSRNVQPPTIATLLRDLRNTAASYLHITGSPVNP